MAIDVRSRLNISDEQLAEFCRKWKIVRLELFGSALREDFNVEKSDLDLLVTFDAGVEWSGYDHVHMQDDFAALVGRAVDLISRKAIEESKNWIRRKHILEAARVVYAI